MSTGEFNDIMTHYEAELLVEKLEMIDIKEYGSAEYNC